ncbi:4'-phosphopantetheinyl transferase superfamily protein [Variovorax sp. M-6]|uniref:4'-phosphopantetheinyl transferase family protein n=1 Tax=Variovorax sp. M-6 TaxID=3233041 RepID=UPI003F9DAB80
MSITPLPCPGPCLLWRVDLDTAPAPVDVACLSEAEWERARRFVFRRDRERFIAAHAALRRILSIRTGSSAALLDFDLGSFGKPSLAGHAGLHFNLSHSQSEALIAVNEASEVGVDIEVLRPMSDAQELAATCFTPNEIRTLQGLPADARERAFLVGWTRKEACLKALGLGLSVNLQALEVGLESVESEIKYADAGCTRRLIVRPIPLGSDAVGALAIDTTRLHLPPLASTKSMAVETIQ